MLPETMTDPCCYLETEIVFRDLSKILIKDFGISCAMDKSPELLRRIKEGTFGMIELSETLHGPECLGLLLELLFSGEETQNIGSILWKLIVIKDSESEVNLNSVLSSSDKLGELTEFLGENDHFKIRAGKVAGLLKSIFPVESEHGLDVLKYAENAVFNGSLKNILPECYTVTYMYKMNAEEDREEFSINFTDCPYHEF